MKFFFPLSVLLIATSRSAFSAPTSVDVSSLSSQNEFAPTNSDDQDDPFILRIKAVKDNASELEADALNFFETKHITKELYDQVQRKTKKALHFAKDAEKKNLKNPKHAESELKKADNELKEVAAAHRLFETIKTAKGIESDARSLLEADEITNNQYAIINEKTEQALKSVKDADKNLFRKKKESEIVIDGADQYLNEARYELEILKAAHAVSKVIQNADEIERKALIHLKNNELTREQFDLVIVKMQQMKELAKYAEQDVVNKARKNIDSQMATEYLKEANDAIQQYIDLNKKQKCRTSMDKYGNFFKECAHKTKGFSSKAMKSFKESCVTIKTKTGEFSTVCGNKTKSAWQKMKDAMKHTWLKLKQLFTRSKRESESA